ncbi:hypothetical protein [Bacillus mycoides]|uniref:hypothetical protein n=1 Tax=Bacillus mycoides TaxID=1405 RepID=UPI001F1BB34C|nr:hypothetical protein [Bacillus mycoides]
MILSPEYSQVAMMVPFLLFYPIMNTVSNTAAICNIILNMLTVPAFGAVGASIAIGGSYIIFFWIRTLISRKL